MEVSNLMFVLNDKWGYSWWYQCWMKGEISLVKGTIRKQEFTDKNMNFPKSQKQIQYFETVQEYHPT